MAVSHQVLHGVPAHVEATRNKRLFIGIIQAGLHRQPSLAHLYIDDTPATNAGRPIAALQLVIGTRPCDLGVKYNNNNNNNYLRPCSSLTVKGLVSSQKIVENKCRQRDWVVRSSNSNLGRVDRGIVGAPLQFSLLSTISHAPPR